MPGPAIALWMIAAVAITPIVRADPEIAVERADAVEIASGDQVDCGTVALGSSSTFTITVRNIGTTDLTDLSITRTGPDHSDFQVGSLGATLLAASDSTTFTVWFVPSMTNTRSVAISLASNDADESPFVINLTCRGTPRGVFDYSASDGVVTITRYTGSDDVVSIPSMLDGRPVSRIGKNVFAANTGLTSVVIPTGVTMIGWSAFDGCSGLTSVSIPDSVVIIGEAAFRGCHSLTSVNLPPGITRIDYYMFENCFALTTVIIPDGVTDIGHKAFYRCSGLGSVTIPSSVTRIGSGSFDGCAGLTEILIPEGVTVIGMGAFSRCRGLTSITIPSSVAWIGSWCFEFSSQLVTIQVDEANPDFHSVDGVLFNKDLTRLLAYPAGRSGPYVVPGSAAEIGYCAFRGCTELTNITIPGSVTNMGTWAFLYCESLQSAVFTGDAPLLDSNAFYTAKGFTVYYYDGATGFTSPTWNDYQSVNLGVYSPVTSWLLAKGLAHDADLQSAPNKDGVTLLMAYALNLDPTRNQSSSLPTPIVAGDQMHLSFHAGSEGVTYSVQASSDLVTWNSAGVTLSEMDADSMRTATISSTGSRGFMRLVVAPAAE